jgi:hypothetical protein
VECGIDYIIDLIPFYYGGFYTISARFTNMAGMQVRTPARIVVTPSENELTRFTYYSLHTHLHNELITERQCCRLGTAREPIC